MSTKLGLEGSRGSRNQKIFSETISHKIFETNSRFHVKFRITGKVLLLFFGTFLLVSTEFLFWEGQWALGFLL